MKTLTENQTYHQIMASFRGELQDYITTGLYADSYAIHLRKSRANSVGHSTIRKMCRNIACEAGIPFVICNPQWMWREQLPDNHGLWTEIPEHRKVWNLSGVTIPKHKTTEILAAPLLILPDDENVRHHHDKTNWRFTIRRQDLFTAYRDYLMTDPKARAARGLEPYPAR
jgi:hypothetical protein